MAARYHGIFRARANRKSRRSDSSSLSYGISHQAGRETDNCTCSQFSSRVSYHAAGRGPSTRPAIPPCGGTRKSSPTLLTYQVIPIFLFSAHQQVSRALYAIVVINCSTEAIPIDKPHLHSFLSLTVCNKQTPRMTRDWKPEI